jgi:hypothetical protein
VHEACWCCESSLPGEEDDPLGLVVQDLVQLLAEAVKCDVRACVRCWSSHEELGGEDLRYLLMIRQNRMRSDRRAVRSSVRMVNAIVNR